MNVKYFIPHIVQGRNLKSNRSLSPLLRNLFRNIYAGASQSATWRRFPSFRRRDALPSKCNKNTNLSRMGGGEDSFSTTCVRATDSPKVLARARPVKKCYLYFFVRATEGLPFRNTLAVVITFFWDKGEGVIPKNMAWHR